MRRGPSHNRLYELIMMRVPGCAKRSTFENICCTFHRSFTRSETMMKSNFSFFQVDKMRIRFDEPQAGVFGVRAMNHGRAEIDAHADRWLDRGQQVPIARAQFQHAHPGRDQEPVELRKPFFDSRAAIRRSGWWISNILPSRRCGLRCRRIAWDEWSISQV